MGGLPKLSFLGDEVCPSLLDKPASCEWQQSIVEGRDIIKKTFVSDARDDMAKVLVIGRNLEKVSVNNFRNLLEIALFDLIKKIYLPL